jgi:predicted alpha-1,2-mannosidase
MIANRFLFLAACVLGLVAPLAARAAQAKELVDYVNPNIGGIGHLLTATQPAVYMPYGMVNLSPVWTPGIMDRYLADKIYGFPVGAATLMATTGPLETDAARAASPFDHDQETTTPYYYSVLLEKYDVEVEYTVSERAMFYRFAFPEKAEARLLLRSRGGFQIKLTGPTTLEGQDAQPGRQAYFAAELSKAPASSGPLGNQAGGLALVFAPAKGERVGLRVGVSNISVEQARRNLAREIPDWNFDAAKAKARDTWNRALAKLTVKGGTEDQRTIFYTAMYRVLNRPHNIVEEDKYLSPIDRKVHPAEGHGFYPDGGGLWGCCRSLHPLQLILDPQMQVDFVNSFLKMYDQGGWLLGTGRDSMIGHHVAVVILDAYMKGYRDFDAEKALAGLKKNATEATMLPWRSGPATALDKVYYEKGFFPSLAKGEVETVPQVHSFERRQAVSVTLEHAYDDWCISELAKALGKTDIYEQFHKRALNYRNLFDQRIGFMAPKTADGNWVEGFDPLLGGGQGGRDYTTEMNSWTYTFYVPHDVAGLVELIGGKDKFLARLDALFVQQYGRSNPKYHFQSQFPDMTGLIGQYSQGNEPSFHIPYLYNYAGQPWKTQQRVRQIMSVWYNAWPLGICGDEDGGEMSSWYVLSAMGFFTVCPGRPVYDIGSPIFEETKIDVGKGKVFTIAAHNVSDKNKYIQSATLNGKPLNKPWFTQTDMVGGGSLVLEMGPRPNTSWGVAPDAAPPSMSR